MTGAAARLVLEDVAATAADAERSFTLRVDRLDLSSGDAVGISGPSGTGKTMLLEVLGLLRRPEPGGRFALETAEGSEDLAAMWSGRNAAAAAPALRGRHFGFVPQSGGLLPFLTVSENIRLSQRIAGRPDPAWQAELEARLGLDGLGALRPGALSIGQRQRVAIARALAHRPPFVIADEPTAALDPGNAAGAMDLLLDAARAGRAGVVISSHDLALLDRTVPRRLHLQLDPSDDPRRAVSRVHEAAGAVAA